MSGTWIKGSNGRWWYKHTDGTYTTNGWEYINGKWYYFDSSGWMVTGWINYKNKRYYCDSSGAMMTGTQVIDGKTYIFDSSGALIQEGATKTKIDKAVEWAVAIAKDDTHGYDQAHRQGPDYDCSSFVSTALNKAGYNINTGNTTSTLYNALTNIGFTPCSSPWKAGDIHLKVGHHVVMSINASQVVHASINEKGTATGGTTGDQTGKEICVRSYYEYTGGWTYHLRAQESGSDISWDDDGNVDPFIRPEKRWGMARELYRRRFILR